MKLLLAGAALASALALSGCSLLGGADPETPPTPASQAPAALPPPAPVAAPPATAPAEPEPDLSGEVPVGEMKCVKPWVLKEAQLPDGKTEMRCAAPG